MDSTFVLVQLFVKKPKKKIGFLEIRLHNIIYKALEELQAAMKGMLAPVYEEVVIGSRRMFVRSIR